MFHCGAREPRQRNERRANELYRTLYASKRGPQNAPCASLPAHYQCLPACFCTKNPPGPGRRPGPRPPPRPPGTGTRAPGPWGPSPPPTRSHQQGHKPRKASREAPMHRQAVTKTDYIYSMEKWNVKKSTYHASCGNLCPHSACQTFCLTCCRPTARQNKKCTHFQRRPASGRAAEGPHVLLKSTISKTSML